MSTARYRVLRIIGRGGMAEVLEAIAIGENGFERRVALKRLLADCAHDDDFLRAFADEARIASQLHHAGVVAVFDYGLIDGLPFIASELVEGSDLAALDETSRALGVKLPVELALFVATEIAHALEYAHQAKDMQGRPMGIVHRDVSPENILISDRGDVKLADFGIARAKHRLSATRIGVAKGKPSYMAPEQVEMRDVDGRADLYSLGVVLGRFLPDGDDEVRAIVDRATRGDRRERFASGAEMAAACGRVMIRRLAEDARTAMRAFMERIAEPKTEQKAIKRVGADLLDLHLVLEDDGPIPRFASRAIAPETETEPDTELREHLIGEIIANHRLVALLGAGSCARVYRGEHEVFEHARAIKVLHGRFARRERMISRLHREAKVLMQIAHPNVVQVFDCGTTPKGLPYLITELCEGRSLFRVLREEAPLDPARAGRIAAQIALGLSAAHAQGIVHRDLKPGNVMIIGEGAAERVKIVDFGLSRVFVEDDAHAQHTALTKASDVIGTPAYMAPEQAEDPTRAMPESDLYALGVILYEMLTAARPHHGELPDVAVSKVALRLLRTDPAERLRDGAAVARAIEGVEAAPKRELGRWRALFLATVAAGVAMGLWMSIPSAREEPVVQAVLPTPRAAAIETKEEPPPIEETKEAPEPIKRLSRAKKAPPLAPPIAPPIERAPIDQQLLRTELAAAKRAIEARAATTDAETFDRLERRYFELHDAVERELDDRGAHRLLEEIRALARSP